MPYFVTALAVVLLFAFCFYQNNKLDITEYKIQSENITGKSIKIAHLSDFHSKPFKKVLNEVKKAEPNLIVITGDYINDKCKNKEKMLAYGKELVQTAPVFYISGNHERRLKNFDGLMRELREMGFNVLLNEISQIKIEGNTVTILGLDEKQGGFGDYLKRMKGTFEYADLSRYFKELDLYGGFKIVLSHFPENFESIKELNYSQYNFDLQLSGHAHGGQFILPFIGPVFSPGQGFFPKYARGEKGTRPKLIISRGLGNSEFPVRLFNHPEIIFITAGKKE